MTTIQIELPEATAKAARDAGLLTPQALERMLNDALKRKEAADSLLSIADRVAAAGIEPMSMEEVNAEVEAARKTNTSSERLLADVRRLAEVIEPPPLPQPGCRDPDDDQVLALAIAAKVELIVSGDDDVLSLRSFQGIPILAPAQAVGIIGTTGKI